MTITVKGLVEFRVVRRALGIGPSGLKMAEIAKRKKKKGEKREKRRKIFSMRDQQVVKSAMQGYGLITMTNS